MTFPSAQYLKQGILGAFIAFFANVSHAVDLTVPVVSGWNLLGNTGATAIDATSLPELFDATKVTSLWKWNSQTSSWVFYAPSLSKDGTLAAYASGKGYQVLSGIAPGEGFWVNAAQPFTLSRTGIAEYGFGASSLVKGWNLVATGEALSPAQLDTRLGGIAAAASFTTMWAWNSTDSKWYFYAPSLAANDTLAAYIENKGYRDFGTLTTGNGLGFWLNSNVAAPQFGGIILSAVNNTDQVTIAWLDAKDGTTPPSQIKYNIHLSATPDFTPTSANLYQSVTGVKQAAITGLTAGTSYNILVLAVNNEGYASSGRKYVSVTTMTDPFIFSSTTPLFDAQSNGLVPPAVAGWEIRYPYTGTEIPPTVGSILVANDATGGYLGRVYGSSIVGNELVVQTTQGSLVEAVHQGAISSKITLFETPLSSAINTNSSQLQSQSLNGEKQSYTNSQNTVEWQDRLLKFEETTNPNGAAGLLIERNNQSGRYLIRAAAPSLTNNVAPQALTGRASAQFSHDAGVMTSTPELSGSASEQFSYDIGVTFTPELTTDIQWSTFGTKIVKAEVIASGTLSLDAEAVYNFAAAAYFNKEYTFDVFKRKWTSVYQAGTVPVYQEITFTLGAQLNAHAYSAINAKTSANVSQTLQFGVRYNTDTGAWEAIAPSTSQSQSATADLSAQGSVTSEIRLIPNIEVKFYKAVAVNLSVEPVISAEIQVTGVSNLDILTGYFPPGTASVVLLDASLNAQCFVGANLQVINYNLPLLSKTQVCNIPAYKFYSLPSLDLSGSRQGDGTYSIVANVTDGDNNKFKDASIKWTIYPDSTGTLMAAGRSATFTPTCDEAKNKTTIFFSGYGVLGEFARQYVKIEIQGCPTLDLSHNWSGYNSYITLPAGSSLQLTVRAYVMLTAGSWVSSKEGDLTVTGLTWTSSNPEVTVVDGLVTAPPTFTAGTVLITATDPLTKATASTSVYVEALPQPK